MSLLEIMKENDIDVNWVFTHVKFHNKEGLFFFESIVKESDEEGEEDEHYFDTKCILIDDAKFIYGDDMEKEIEINVINGNVIFNRVDGAEVSIPENEFKDLPFRLTTFSNSVSKHSKPTDYVEV